MGVGTYKCCCSMIQHFMRQYTACSVLKRLDYCFPGNNCCCPKAICPAPCTAASASDFS